MTVIRKTLAAAIGAAAMIAVQAASAVNVTLNTPSSFEVLGMSPNGKWACGVFVDAGGGTSGFRWNLESGSIEMLDANENVAWDVSNDGTVSGDFTDMTSLGNGIPCNLPGYWSNGSWHSLEMPAGVNVTDGFGGSISPDGRYVVGTVQMDGIYRGCLWRNGSLVKIVPSDSHSVAYAVSPDGLGVAGWAQKYNRTACYWHPDGTAEFLMDSPSYSQSPWNYCRNFSPDGSKLVYWGGWDPEVNEKGEDVLWLYCIYDIKTGERIRVKAPTYDSDMEFFDISNSGVAVGSNGGRGYLLVDLEGVYIDDYLSSRGVDLSSFDDFYGGSDAYVGQLPISNIIAISEDENVLLCKYYNTSGQLASLCIKIDQDASVMAPADVKVSQLNGVNAAAVTWSQPVGISGLRGYNVYRNGKKLNMLPITQQYYYDKKLDEGEYEYVVSSVVSNGTETKAEAVNVSIEQSKLPAPFSLYARQKGSSSAILTWNAPLSNLVHKTYYDPEATDLMGFSVYEPTTVETAIRYTRAELQCYDGYEIREVSFVPMGQQDGWAVNIYSRSSTGALTLIKSQPVTGEIEIGQINTVTLDTPVDLPSSDLIVAIEVTVGEDADEVIGAQSGKMVAGFSDLLRRKDDASFFSAYESSVETGYYVYCLSWSIDLGLKLKGDTDETTTTGYAIYVDGESKDETTDNVYIVRNLTSGNHTLSVEALYNEGGNSEIVSTDVNIAATYPAVEEATVESDKEVSTAILAKWDTPTDHDVTSISYSNEGNEISQGIKGPASNSYALMAAAEYPASLLRSFGGYRIDSFKFYPLCDAIFTFMLYEDDEMVYEYEVPTFVVGQWNEVKLPEDVYIKENATYFLALDCFDPEPNTYILPLDNKAPRPFYSDLYSIDNGETWSSMTYETGTHGSWMMGMTISDAEGLKLDVSGYDVVIDGEVRNSNPVADTWYSFDFGKSDDNRHSLRIDTYYPARAIAVAGGETHFHLSAAGIESVTVADIKMTCGPNYLVVDGVSVDNISIFNVAGQEMARVKGNKVNITSMEPGVYVARIHTASRVINRKFRLSH